jgi:hypothetical protein
MAEASAATTTLLPVLYYIDVIRYNYDLPICDLFLSLFRKFLQNFGYSVQGSFQ